MGNCLEKKQTMRSLEKKWSHVEWISLKRKLSREIENKKNGAILGQFDTKQSTR